MRLVVLLLVVFSGVAVLGVNAADETQPVVASEEEQAVAVYLSHFTDATRRNAKIATEEQLRSMWLECDKVIDF